MHLAKVCIMCLRMGKSQEVMVYLNLSTQVLILKRVVYKTHDKTIPNNDIEVPPTVATMQSRLETSR